MTSPISVEDVKVLLEGTTPGPWRVGRQDGAPSDHIVDMGEPPKAPYMMLYGRAPATGVHHSDGPREEVVANCRLIAASPSIARAYVALAERVGVLEEALSQLEGKARLGGDCLGNSPPNFEPCQRSFYMLADIARAALTPKASADEQEIG
jgi:hypothetical protein